MSKYSPLGEFLRKQPHTRVPMTFRDIEKVIGARLPNSKLHRAWWSNNPFNNVMTDEWLKAGFKTGNVDIEAEKVVFFKDVTAETPPQSIQKGTSKIFGSMRGSLRLHPDTDLTAPADPAWGKLDGE